MVWSKFWDSDGKVYLYFKFGWYPFCSSHLLQLLLPVFYHIWNTLWKSCLLSISSTIFKLHRKCVHCIQRVTFQLELLFWGRERSCKEGNLERSPGMKWYWGDTKTCILSIHYEFLGMPKCSVHIGSLTLNILFQILQNGTVELGTDSLTLGYEFTVDNHANVKDGTSWRSPQSHHTPLMF